MVAGICQVLAGVSANQLEWIGMLVHFTRRARNSDAALAGHGAHFQARRIRRLFRGH